MRFKTGENVENIVLPAIDGSIFDMKSFTGKPFMISFYRFATCPFCNLRVNELVRRFDEFQEDFTMIAIFDSKLDHLTQHTEGHHAPFPILADEKRSYYKAYGIERSVCGFFVGMIFRLPTLLKAIFSGYLPNLFTGGLTIMPADFLVDREGNIKVAYYGRDEGDHLPFDQVKDFALNNPWEKIQKHEKVMGF